MSGKVAKAKEDKDASKGKMRPLLCTVCLYPRNHIFYASTLSFIPFVLRRLGCDVRLETMAALANHSPAWCMWLLLVWGVSSSDLIGLHMFCVFGHDMKTQ